MFFYTRGFFYENNSEQFTVEKSNISANLEFTAGNYEGQKNGIKGCGAIYSPNDYVLDRYNKDYKLVSYKSLAMDRCSQFKLSCYLTTLIKDGVPKVYSEGNCPIVSVYHALQYLQKTKWPNMPSFNEKCLYDPYIYEPNQYFARFDITGQPKYSNIRKQSNEILETFPVLYKDVRTTSIDIFNEFENMTIGQSCTLIEKVAKNYNHNLKTSENVFYKFALDDGIDRINSNIPMLLSLLEDATYGSHTMAVCGYRIYEQKTKILWFDVTNKVILYEVADGWYTEKTYYDMSATNTLGELVFINF